MVANRYVLEANCAGCSCFICRTLLVMPRLISGIFDEGTRLAVSAIFMRAYCIKNCSVGLNGP